MFSLAVRPSIIDFFVEKGLISSQGGQLLWDRLREQEPEYIRPATEVLAEIFRENIQTLHRQYLEAASSGATVDFLGFLVDKSIVPTDQVQEITSTGDGEPEHLISCFARRLNQLNQEFLARGKTSEPIR